MGKCEKCKYYIPSGMVNCNLGSHIVFPDKKPSGCSDFEFKGGE